jgi:DNA-binding transcriptional MerR regulator
MLKTCRFAGTTQQMDRRICSLWISSPAENSWPPLIELSLESLMEAVLDPQTETKHYYHISEVAKMMNMTVPNLRFWESQFEILKPKKNKRGDRFFTRQDLEYLKVIHHLLKEKGYTIEGARKKLKQNPHDMIDKVAVIEKLKEVRSFLASLKEYLDRPQQA